jgi:hypothetical protein
VLKYILPLLHIYGLESSTSFRGRDLRSHPLPHEVRMATVKLYRRWWDSRIVATESDNSATATHKVSTPFFWIAANCMGIGTEVRTARSLQRASRISTTRKRDQRNAPQSDHIQIERVQSIPWPSQHLHCESSNRPTDTHEHSTSQNARRYRR